MMGKNSFNPNWEKILNAINDGLVVIGSDGKIAAVNRAFQNLLGYREEEIVGKPCTLLDCDACEGTLKNDGVFWCNLFEKEQSIRQYCIMTKKPVPGMFPGGEMRLAVELNYMEALGLKGRVEEGKIIKIGEGGGALHYYLMERTIQESDLIKVKKDGNQLVVC